MGRVRAASKMPPEMFDSSQKLHIVADFAKGNLSTCDWAACDQMVAIPSKNQWLLAVPEKGLTIVRAPFEDTITFSVTVGPGVNIFYGTCKPVP